MQKFVTAEKFVASVKLCYESRHVVGPSTSPIGSVQSMCYSGRKRVKNTSGPEVSPGTFQSQLALVETVYRGIAGNEPSLHNL